jgi:hypothetical protein
MNFGKYYVHCIETLYANIETCIINNGNLSNFFKPSRGIRQGCPVSANLFIIIVQALAVALRKTTEFRE